MQIFVPTSIMSSTATPISASRFAEAIRELPLANLHFKVAEICNSIVHLLSSNQQLQIFVNEGDSDCADAVQENLLVLQRMKERLLLLKGEMENRGCKWVEDGTTPVDMRSNGHAGIKDVRELLGMINGEPNTPHITEQMDGLDEDGARGGVHL